MRMSLSTVLDAPGSPVVAYMRQRFPNVHDLQRRYRQAVAGVTPLAPTDGIANYGTAGTAFDWRVRLLLDPAPDFGLAVRGASLLGKPSLRAAAELISYLGGGAFSLGATGPRPVDLADAFASPAAPDRGEEDLARACYALAFYTETYRAGLLVAARSRLVALGSDVTLDQVLGLATQAEVADWSASPMPPGACWSRR